MPKFHDPVKEYLDFVEKNKEAWQNCKFFMIYLPSNLYFSRLIINLIEKKYGYNPNCLWGSVKALKI